MNEILLKLFQELWEKKIGKNDFFKKATSLTDFVFNEDSCLEVLNKAYSENDSDTIDIFISIGFMIGFSEKALPILCKLLVSNSHHKHEDIAMLLSDMKNPKTSECLYEAAEMEFDYLDYDDSYQFGRKCIKALAAINDENSVNKLKLLSKSSITEIAEFAQKELNYRIG